MLMIALLSLVAVATQAPASAIAIKIATTELRLTPPESHCVPIGEGAAVAQVMEAADTLNLTLATLVDCRPGAQPYRSYYLVKTPRGALLSTIQRPELMAQLGPAFQAIDLAALQKQVDSGLTTALGRDLKLDVGSIKPAGQDEVCGYLAGELRMTGADGKPAAVTMAGCMTTVRGKLLTIYHYQPAGSESGLAKHLAVVRAVADRMIADNE
jgi:hypothetical protein